MLEATLKNGEVLRKIITAISDLVTDANFDCREQGMSLQAMDSSHVSLVSMLLRCEGFDPWRCDRSCQLGIHLEHMMKLLKCMASKDSIEMRETIVDWNQSSNSSAAPAVKPTPSSASHPSTMIPSSSRRPVSSGSGASES